jgi:hypothetical protein
MRRWQAIASTSEGCSSRPIRQPADTSLFRRDAIDHRASPFVSVRVVPPVTGAYLLIMAPQNSASPADTNENKTTTRTAVGNRR